MPFTVPVNVGLANGALVAIKFVVVVAKLGSLFSAVANSFNVSNVDGAEATKLATVVLIYDAWAVDTGLFKSDVLSTLPNPTKLDVIPFTVPVNYGFANGALFARSVTKPVTLD